MPWTRLTCNPHMPPHILQPFMLALFLPKILSSWSARVVVITLAAMIWEFIEVDSSGNNRVGETHAAVLLDIAHGIAGALFASLMLAIAQRGSTESPLSLDSGKRKILAFLLGIAGYVIYWNVWMPEDFIETRCDYWFRLRVSLCHLLLVLFVCLVALFPTPHFGPTCMSTLLYTFAVCVMYTVFDREDYFSLAHLCLLILVGFSYVAWRVKYFRD